MPALLIRDGELPVQMQKVGTIRCNRDGCACSYTLRSNDPVSMVGKEKNTDVMGRMAFATVRVEHPIHATKTYYWKGPELGWLAADTQVQRESL
jgi:hypothetical protein